MNVNKKIGWQVAAVVTVATLCGPSAFAEDRHRNGTRSAEERVSRGEGRVSREAGGGINRIERSTSGQQVQPQESTARTAETSRYRDGNRADVQRDRNRGENRSVEPSTAYDSRHTQSRDTYDRGNRNESYSRGDARNRNDSYNRGDSRNRNDSYNRGDSRGRNDSYGRSGSYDRNRSYGRNDSYRGGHGTPYYTHGRVSRLERYNGGYRVWIAGGLYPFFIPEVRFRLFPFRVGLDVRLGGYYNPLGYYDYYDGPAGVYTAGSLRGVVESVDYRRGTFVLHDDISGDFVTALMTGGDRRWDSLRPGDFIEVSGEWTRSGVFQAYRLDAVGDGYYRR